MGRFWFLYLSILDYIFISRAENLTICFLFFLSSSSFCLSREREPRRFHSHGIATSEFVESQLYTGISFTPSLSLLSNQIRLIWQELASEGQGTAGTLISAVSQTWWRKWHSFDHSELKRLPIALNACLFATRWCLQVEFRTFQRKKSFFFLLSCCKFSCEHFHF